MNLHKTLRTLTLTSVSLLSITGCSEIFVNKVNSHSTFDVTKVTFDKDTYPAVVLGGGVGGMTASVYLAMANVKTLLVQGAMPGGLLTQSLSVRNWPSELESTGLAITDKLLAQVRKQGVDIKAEQAIGVDVSSWPYKVTLADVSEPSRKRIVKALTVVIAVGAASNYLGVPGEKEYWSKGVTNCAVCEGALYKDKVVCVVGGGNSAIEEAHYLAGLARKVYVFVRRDTLRATDNRKDDLLSLPNVEIVYEHSIKKIVGDDNKVTEVVVVSNRTKVEKTYPMDGIFLAIGFTPNTAIFKDALAITKGGYIALTHDQQTSVPGVYAVGDVVDPRYKQAVTAAGDGCRSALQAYDFLAQAGYKPGHMGDELTMKRDLEKKEGVTTAPAIEEQTGFAVQEDAKKPGLEHSYAPGIVHEMRSTQEITALIKGSSKPVIIDFYATWCGPCRTIAPLYKKLAERYKDAAIFAKVNIDNLGGVATNYRIQGVPTFVFIKSGAEKDRIVGGGATEKQFAEKIDALI